MAGEGTLLQRLHLDGDADLEPDLAGTPNKGVPCDAEGDDADAEPNLGSLASTSPFDFMPTRGAYTSQVRWAAGGRTDLELDDSDLEDSHDREASDLANDTSNNLEEDDAQREPSLGSLDGQLNQENWTSTNDALDQCADRELDTCDDEEGDDTEPNGDELDGPDDNGSTRQRSTLCVDTLAATSKLKLDTYSPARVLLSCSEKEIWQQLSFGKA